MLEGYYIKKIGQNRGAPRVWLEGTQTERAGFRPGQKFDVIVQGHTIVLQANPDGTRVVSSKKAGEKQNPVIDINSRELLAIFDGMSAVRVAVKSRTRGRGHVPPSGNGARPIQRGDSCDRPRRVYPRRGAR